MPDAALAERIVKIHQDNHSVYAIPKIWHARCREGIGIGYEQTARLMRLAD
ncbi:IS3 family transposase [Corynebacterium sp. HS2168-gen11]|uniref:IS3 family transposase n=1 Tax=Corynebacterium sp. HS2168-gen11 TaxID=2974027 RepID=UPI0037BE8C29